MRYQRFIKISIIIFLLGGIILIFLPKQWAHFFYQPSYVGMMFFASAVLIYLPKIFFRSDDPSKKELVAKVQAVMAASLLMNGAGELGFYQLYLIGFEYDKLIHFITPFLFTVVFSEILLARKNYSFWQIAWRAALVILASGIIWEFWEAFSDILFQTQEWGVYGKYATKDTFGDIMWNLTGITLGLAFFKNLKKEKFSEIEK